MPLCSSTNTVLVRQRVGCERQFDKHVIEYYSHLSAWTVSILGEKSEVGDLKLIDSWAKRTKLFNKIIIIHIDSPFMKVAKSVKSFVYVRKEIDSVICMYNTEFLKHCNFF